MTSIKHQNIARLIEPAKKIFIILKNFGF